MSPRGCAYVRVYVHDLRALALSCGLALLCVSCAASDDVFAVPTPRVRPLREKSQRRKGGGGGTARGSGSGGNKGRDSTPSRAEEQEVVRCARCFIDLLSTTMSCMRAARHITKPANNSSGTSFSEVKNTC